jgi:hypothetical protein
MRFGYAVSIALLIALGGPRQVGAQEVGTPNFAGSYRCAGRCAGGVVIQQSGAGLICINERNEVATGKVTGRRSFTGCWGLNATVSEDLRSIDWHNETYWVR